MSKNAFTLVEVMVVVVVVGILAAVAVPKMVGCAKRAMASEAIAGCAVIKRHLETEDVSGGVTAGTFDPVTTLDNDVFSADLGGTFFSSADYKLVVNSATDWTITVKGATGSKVDGVTVTMAAGGSPIVSF